MFRWILAGVISLSAYATDLARAPQNFSYQNSQAIFVDFQDAEYRIRYDVSARTAAILAKIRFEATASGYPIFDLKPSAASVTLNGQKSGEATVKTPDNATTLKVLTTKVDPGMHEMVITVALTSLVEWTNGGVHSAFWMSDLSDRQYLEQFMPTNLEFDQYAMTFDVQFQNATKRQVVYTNGEVEQVSADHFIARYPAYFTASSLFFHTVPEGVMSEERFVFNSIDGRALPVVIYLKPSFFGGNPASTLAKLKSETIKIMNELEADYGAFLHPSLTIYNAGSGGMEYCGATITSASALGHELTHSYFARGVIPANGNAGWIDEAIASWRDKGYPRGSGFSGSSNMAGRAAYTRTTAYAAYSYGASFMGNLDNHLADQGGLKPLLRRLVAEKAFTPFFTEDFVEWAEGHYRASLMPIFKRHVYSGSSSKMSVEECVHHKKLSEAELRNLL